MTMKNTELVRFLPKCLSVIDIVINSLKITISGEKKNHKIRELQNILSWKEQKRTM